MLCLTSSQQFPHFGGGSTGITGSGTSGIVAPWRVEVDRTLFWLFKKIFTLAGTAVILAILSRQLFMLLVARHTRGLQYCVYLHSSHYVLISIGWHLDALTFAVKAAGYKDPWATFQLHKILDGQTREQVWNYGTRLPVSLELSLSMSSCRGQGNSFHTSWSYSCVTFSISSNA